MLITVVPEDKVPSQVRDLAAGPKGVVAAEAQDYGAVQGDYSDHEQRDGQRPRSPRWKPTFGQLAASSESQGDQKL